MARPVRVERLRRSISHPQIQVGAEVVAEEEVVAEAVVTAVVVVAVAVAGVAVAVRRNPCRVQLAYLHHVTLAEVMGLGEVVEEVVLHRCNK